MKKWTGIVCALALMLMATGCGKSSFDPSVSSLYIQKNGKITEAIVESFEKPVYSVTELQSMVEKEIDTYNQSFGEELISIQRLEAVNDVLYLLLDYENADAYSQYNEAYCFIGTVSEALEEGLPFNLVFKDADYEEYTAAEATAKTGNSIVVLKEEGVVELENDVKYVSNNVEILDDRMVQVMPITDSEEYAYIIF